MKEYEISTGMKVKDNVKSVKKVEKESHLYKRTS